MALLGCMIGVTSIALPVSPASAQAADAPPPRDDVAEAPPTSGTPAAPDAAENAIILQLRWRPQFQFAGYYAALWNGYYADAGLNVTIRSGVKPDGEPLHTVDEVAAGHAHFGIGAADILTARDAGSDLVILESLFQTTPAAVYVRETADYQRLTDLQTLRVMGIEDRELNLVVAAMLHAQGAPLSSMNLIPRGAARFDGVDAFVGHSLSTPLRLEHLGIRVLEVKPRHYGVDFYGDTLFTTRAMVETRIDTVEAFTEATLRGWHYAIEHPEEIAARLSRDFPLPETGPSASTINRFQIGRVLDLLGHPLVELGHINPLRWQTMHATLRDMGVVEGDFDPGEVIFDRFRLTEMRSQRLHHNLLGTLAFLAVLLLVVAIFAILLRQAVATRTRELAESEERFRLLIDNMQGYAIYALDADGHIVSWNRAAEALTGYSGNDVLGRHYASLFRDTERQMEEPLRVLSVASRDGRCEFEGQQQTKDGRDVWVHSVVSAVHDQEGSLRGFATITRDMSESRSQQERIIFQAALLNRVRAAVIATDADSRVVYMNAYAEALFLLPWRDAAGRRLDELNILPDAGSRTLASGERHEREVEARRNDGRQFPALCITSLTSEPGGRGRTEIHVIHDLTERKRMEQALQHTSNLALLGRMSASLVHEISQPMNVIRLTAEGGLLRLGRQQNDPADMEKRLRTIAEQASRLFDTIDLMQAFSRRDMIPATPSDARFDACTMVKNVVAEERQAFDTAGVALEVHLPDAPLVAAGRPRQFEQVLHNLLSNALHALAEHGGTRQLVRITLTGPTPSDSLISLHIDDTGPGIPASQREAIFEPFYTTKPAGKGTGLGLYISLGLVRAMGGALDVGVSDLGGAHFVIRMPAQDGDAPPDTSAAQTSVPAGTAASAQASPRERAEDPESSLPHILVVDDEALARMEISDSLRARGYRVSEASSGREALDVLLRHNGGPNGEAPDAPAASTAPYPVDVVITDIRMPGGSGSDLIHHMSEDYPQVFTLVMTGQPLEDREDLAELGGADAILRKPISLEDLDGRLSALLDAGAEDD